MTAPASSLDEVLAVYDRWAGDPYDEVVTQLSHALQSAALARAAGAAEPLVAAALLHDVGHLLNLAEGHPVGTEGDVRHESIGAAYLASLFGPDVTAPIALHVQAKRYLCAVEPSYAASLSVGSVASLARQGGPFSEEEVAVFARHPGNADAVLLRRWDDEAKVEDADAGQLSDHEPLLRRLLRR